MTRAPLPGKLSMADAVNAHVQDKYGWIVAGSEEPPAWPVCCQLAELKSDGSFFIEPHKAYWSGGVWYHGAQLIYVGRITHFRPLPEEDRT